jgi:hypothetical protein
MRKQGSCSLPADDAGRILDRLAGLEKVIPPEQVRQALLATGKSNGRACPLTHEVVLWVVLAMGVLTDVPIRMVFKHARRLRRLEDSPGRSALCQARQRLGVEPVRHLFEQVVRPLATPERTPAAFSKGLRRMGLDGTVYEVPDLPDNAARFGRSSAGAERGEGAFPQLRKLRLVELGTHVEVAFAWQGIRGDGGEQDLVEALIPAIPAGSLLHLDSNFFSYDLWTRLDSHGVKLLVRVSSTPLLTPLQTLKDGSYLAKIYQSSYDREKDRHGIVVRVIRYTLDDPQRVGHAAEHRLVTNLLDADAYPAEELIAEYHERWEEELVFDEQKTHQDPRRASKPAQLRSQTPAGVEQELYALSLGHFVVRALMTEAAAQAQVDPDRLSFTGCFHILRCRLPECDSRTPQTLQAWYEAVLEELARERTEPRRNRINPRVIKRKMSKWKKKHPEHRPVPPLKKTFAETVVVIT